MVAILILFGIIGSCDSTNTPSSTTTYTAPVPSAPTYTPPQPSGGSSPAANVYRLPSSVSSTLNSEKAEIESERASLEALEAQVETLGRDIDSDRLHLDRTSQYSVDEFNAKVARYNSLAQRAKLATAAFNQKVDNYNAKLR
jgi:hypothetical protein